MGNAKSNGVNDVPSAGRQQKHAADARTISRASKTALKQDDYDPLVDTEAHATEEPEELQLRQATASISYSGMLPLPEIYKQYDKQTQERMCKWNDAYTSDESARQNKLVEHEIKQKTRGAIFSFVLALVFVGATLYAFIKTQSPYSFLFLSAPVINVIGSFTKPPHSKQ